MTALLVLLCIGFITIIVIQVGKITELAGKIRGEKEMELNSNRRQGFYLFIFMIAFLVISSVSAYYYKNYFLGYGPNQAASAHGDSLDSLFSVTLFFTGIVFFATQILLFYYAYRYKAQKGTKAAFISHDNKLEIVWTVIPAVVMAFLVISGLDVWNEVMADVNEDEEYMEIEATGYQFAWALRYPGEDGKLGRKNFRLIKPGSNELGVDWDDEASLDDFLPDELVLPVNKQVRVRITARDVLHNFYLPHFRLKMDAIPGLPTYFVFTPTKTTEEYRQQLSEYAEYQVPADPEDPESPMLWEVFDYELACAELCGKGHWSMRKTVRIVSEEEYEQWLASQNAYYMQVIRGTEDDPYTDIWFESEIEERKEAFNQTIEGLAGKADTASLTAEERTLQFGYVNFETGSATLTATSKYELGFLVEAMKKYGDMQVALAGHTDNVGEPDANMVLSQERAQVVFDFLVENGIEESRLTSAGYGETQPIDDNKTEAGREKNRRLEYTIEAI